MMLCTVAVSFMNVLPRRNNGFENKNIIFTYDNNIYNI